MVDDRRHEAEINFGRVASRPRRYVAFLNNPYVPRLNKTPSLIQIMLRLECLSEKVFFILLTYLLHLISLR